MTTHLVCYADDRFRHAQDRLVRSAAGRGVDVVHAFGRKDLEATAFYSDHKAILDQPRGGGYWLWKPFFIRQVLGQASPGDVVLYVDSGAELIDSVEPLVGHCRAVGGLVLFANHSRANRYWTKRDAYVAVGADTEACYAADQVNAAFSAWQAGSEAAAGFLDAWLDLCRDAQLLTDAPSRCGLPELPDYITHLHDQTLASLLAFVRGTKLYRDPSQIGNHMKPPPLRVAGEHLDLPHALVPDPSPYPTLFHHHRDARKPPSSPVERLVHAAKRTYRQVVPKVWTSPFAASADLAPVMARNRTTLSALPRWFDPAADTSSQFSYGIPPTCRALLDRPIGPQPTVPDLIGSLTDALGERMNYLEIGVSVGRNMYQQIRGGKRRTFTGFDIEEVHPNLSSRLTRGQREEWDSSPGSLKRGPASLTTFADHVQGNKLRYLSGDVFDEACWQRLAGQTFNIIYSDALHRPEGLMHEWAMIRRYDLLDHDEFVMVWDDLGGIMSLAFDRIAEQLAGRAGGCDKLTFPMLGWLGQNEYPHQVGLLYKLRTPPAWLKRMQQAAAGTA